MKNATCNKDVDGIISEALQIKVVCVIVRTIEVLLGIEQKEKICGFSFEIVRS